MLNRSDWFCGHRKYCVKFVFDREPEAYKVSLVLRRFQIDHYVGGTLPVRARPRSQLPA